MRKSKKTGIIAFSFIIIVLLISAIVLIFKYKVKDLTYSLYESMINNQSFTLTMEEDNSEYKYDIIIARRDTDISIDMNTKYLDESQHTTTIVTDGIAYYVIHDNQEYMTLDSQDIEVNELMPEMKDVEGKEYHTGKEKINGNSYYYEEYEDIDIYLMLINVSEEGKVKTRFYYDNNKQIVYIKNIVEEEGEETKEEILKVSCIYNAEDSLFEVPNEYAETEI